jgi:outer membrane protein
VRSVATMVAAILFLPIHSQALEVLTWQDCVRLAKEHNSFIQSAQSKYTSSEHAASASYAAFMPQIRAGLNQTTTTTNGAESDNYNASLSGSIELFSGLRDRAKIKETHYQAQGLLAVVDSASAQAGYELKSAFESLIYAKNFHELTAEIIKRREENSRTVDLRYRGGLENKGSQLLAQAYFEQARYDELQAKNLIKIYRVQLAKVIGRDDPTEFDIEGQVNVADFNPEKMDFQKLMMDVPDYKKVQAEEEAARQNITVSRAGFFPKLNLTARISEEGPDFFPNVYQGRSIGIGLTIPLFDGTSDYHGVKGAAATWAAKVSDRKHLGRTILERLETAYAGFEQAVARYKVDQSFALATQARAEIARKKYSNGLLTFDAWDVIENDLIARQKAVLASKRDRVIAESEWERVRGVGLWP